MNDGPRNNDRKNTYTASPTHAALFGSRTDVFGYAINVRE